MSHFAFRDRLIALRSSTLNDPDGFLQGLSSIHDDWHQPDPRTYGFLLFHHRVVRYFDEIVNGPLNLGIVAFKEADLGAMGVAPLTASTAGVDTLGELSAYSGAVEPWHGGAHGGIETATGVPMMDPRVNIFYEQFWKLHKFIDARFRTVLAQYAKRAHPGSLATPFAAASHIESAHHGWVAQI
jgi:hypothetical protein